MERHVKERLVGAAVLIAAAIILIPEMLSGPDHDAPNEVATAQNGETPLKTYTIDLTKSPATLAAERAIDNRAPPAEVAATTPEPASSAQTNPEFVAGDADSVSGAASQAAGSAAPVVASSQAGSSQAGSPQVSSPRAPAAVRQPATEATASPRTPAPAPAAGNPVAPVAGAAKAGSKGETKGEKWAVQLGSFASRVTAERMVKTLKADGHDAFVMPVKSGQATLYRVRIGPMQDRETAAQVLRKVKATAPGAAVVTHP